MALPAVPGIEQIGEPVVDDARDLTNHGRADQPPKPYVTGGPEPGLDGAIGPDIQPALGVHGMQAAAHVFDPGTEAGKHVGLEIDVAKLDSAGAGCTDKPAA